MSFFQKNFGWAVLVSELSHVFCCVIPTVVTILSAFANIGLFVVSPDGILMTVHEALHDYEIPIILFSGVMLVFGWAAHLASRQVDCHDTGCVHPPCSPQKSRNSKILGFATILFAINLVIYFGVHRNVFDLSVFETTVKTEHHDHAHDDHHHSE